MFALFCDALPLIVISFILTYILRLEARVAKERERLSGLSKRVVTAAAKVRI